MKPNYPARAVAEAAKRGTGRWISASTTLPLEPDADVRLIQTLLGRVFLETTLLKTKVAVFKQRQVGSPLDVLTGRQRATHASSLPTRAACTYMANEAE